MRYYHISLYISIYYYILLYIIIYHDILLYFIKYIIKRLLLCVYSYIVLYTMQSMYI